MQEGLIFLSCFYTTFFSYFALMCLEDLRVIFYRSFEEGQVMSSGARSVLGSIIEEGMF